MISDQCHCSFLLRNYLGKWQLSINLILTQAFKLHEDVGNYVQADKPQSINIAMETFFRVII